MRSETRLRVARPTDHIEKVVHFYTEGLGLVRLDSFEDHEGFDGVMLGVPGAAYHLEFTRRRGQVVGPAPSEDDLLVFYLPDDRDWQEAVERMQRAGYEPVTPSNPYWDRAGRTFEDPDGYRVVLQNASPPEADRVPALTDRESDDLRRHEEELWRAETRFDRGRMSQVFATDFFEFGMSGRRHGLEEMLAAEPHTIDATMPLPDFEVRLLAPNVAQVAYTSVVVRDRIISRALRSSIWTRSDGRWRLRFHQGTPHLGGA